MSTSDIYTADFPHGTDDGWARGCTSNGACPNHDDANHLTCKEAHFHRASDYNARKLPSSHKFRTEDLRPAEAAVKRARTAPPAPDPAPVPKPSAPLTVTPLAPKAVAAIAEATPEVRHGRNGKPLKVINHDTATEKQKRSHYSDGCREQPCRDAVARAAAARKAGKPTPETSPSEVLVEPTESSRDGASPAEPAAEPSPSEHATPDGEPTESTTAKDAPRAAIAIDTTADRMWTTISITTYSDDGAISVERVARQAGMLWVVPRTKEIREATGINRVALQMKGSPASEFVAPLQVAGFEFSDTARTKPEGGIAAEWEAMLPVSQMISDEVVADWIVQRDDLATISSTTPDDNPTATWHTPPGVAILLDDLREAHERIAVDERTISSLETEVAAVRTQWSASLSQLRTEELEFAKLRASALPKVELVAVPESKRPWFSFITFTLHIGK